MANEDYLTYAQRKLLILVARSQIGAHYLKGGHGRIPDDEGLQLLGLNCGKSRL